MSGQDAARRFNPGPSLSPVEMTKTLLPLVAGWPFQAMNIGSPARYCTANRSTIQLTSAQAEWASTFAGAVRLINDVAMQALGIRAAGGDHSGSLLSLGLGTGLGRRWWWTETSSRWNPRTCPTASTPLKMT